MRFIDLFAGLGGFHVALQALGHECVFASEIDPELRALYGRNFPESRNVIVGDIRLNRNRIPRHDILCAGFPCQPFSKSGFQNGLKDSTRGTLFHEILAILADHRPRYVLLENVGNFERHDRGRTWHTVRNSLQQLGYDVRGTTHIASGGHGLISPHHLGYPHKRERFFIAGSLGGLADDPFPPRDNSRETTLADIVQPHSDLSVPDRVEVALSQQQLECIAHWNLFLRRLPKSVALPSFPLWGDEIGARYPYERATPYGLSFTALKHALGLNGHSPRTKAELLALLPRYARSTEPRFPSWKTTFIRSNRAWFQSVESSISGAWLKRLREFPPSLRKLEWNCKGEERDLWKHALQFRPSGLRVKRFSSCPALVAMTVTQIPILGPHRRFITRIEGLRLQGFSDKHELPTSKAAAFAALGNAVHTEVVKEIVARLLETAAREKAHPKRTGVDRRRRP